MESANGNKSEFVSEGAVLRDMFPGVEFGLLDRWVEREFGGSVERMNGKEKVPLFENKIDLMGRTEEFLEWLRNREERVVVGEFYLCFYNILFKYIFNRTCFHNICHRSVSQQCQATPHGFSPCAPSPCNTNLKRGAWTCSRRVKCVRWESSLSR